MDTALADGHFRKGGKVIPNLQFRRKLPHDMMENIIGGDTVDSGRPRRTTCTPYIVSCTLLKVKLEAITEEGPEGRHSIFFASRSQSMS